MLPAPTTSATSTPRAATEVICSAIRVTRSGSVPYSSDPISASPESFSRTRLKRGDAIGWRSYGLQRAFTPRACAPKARPVRPRLVLPHLEAREAGDANMLLLQQGDVPVPFRELPVDDLSNHVVRLALLVRLRLEHRPFRLPGVAGDLLGRHIEGRRRCPRDVESHLAGEFLEFRRAGDEVCLAADLDQDADLAGGVD